MEKLPIQFPETVTETWRVWIWLSTTTHFTSAVKVAAPFSFKPRQSWTFKIHVSAVCTLSSQSLILDAAVCFSTTFRLMFEAGSLLLKRELSASTRLAGRWALAMLLLSATTQGWRYRCVPTYTPLLCACWGSKLRSSSLCNMDFTNWVIFGAQHPNLLLLLYMTLSSMVFPAEHHATEFCLLALVRSWVSCFALVCMHSYPWSTTLPAGWWWKPI